MEIEISAKFTLDELREVLQKVREIEQKDPKRFFGIWIEAPELNRDEICRLFESIFKKSLGS